MNDSKDFQDVESIRSGNSNVTTQPVCFPPHPIPGGMLSRSIGMPSRRRAAKHLGHTWYIGKRFCKSRCVISSAPYRRELNPWSSSTEEPLHSSTVEKSERRTQDQDQKCQSGQSAKNSVIFSGGDSSKNHGQTNNDCSFQIFISTSSLRQQPSLAGR